MLPRHFDPYVDELRALPVVLTGASLLALQAGYVNAILLTTLALPVSHMSGVVSRLSVDLARGNAVDLGVVAGVVLGFLAGAALSGLLVGATNVRLGRRYGVVLVAEGAVLGLATALLAHGSAWGAVLAASACGMQNGMASNYSGLILRTTHVTGIVTDLGVLLGQWLRHRRVDGWNFVLLGATLAGFLLGGGLGALGATLLGGWATAPAALFSATLGCAYFVWRVSRMPAVAG